MRAVTGSGRPASFQNGGRDQIGTVADIKSESLAGLRRNSHDALQAQDTTAFIRQKLTSVEWGQYMTQHCHDAAVEHWAGFPTQRCDYESRSGFGSIPVILLDPDERRLADWLATACTDAKVPDVPRCAERVAVQIKCQSNNQFPVAGFVEENSLFLFRDGLTVSIAGVDTGRDIGLSRAPNADEIDLTLSRGAVTAIWQWARIAGTGRGDFANLFGKHVEQMEGPSWLETVRAEYQAAWNSKRNRLVSAWALAHSSQIDETMKFDTFFSQTCPAGTKWTRWF